MEEHVYKLDECESGRNETEPKWTTYGVRVVARKRYERASEKELSYRKFDCGIHTHKHGSHSYWN